MHGTCELLLLEMLGKYSQVSDAVSLPLETACESNKLQALLKRVEGNGTQEVLSLAGDHCGLLYPPFAISVGFREMSLPIC